MKCKCCANCTWFGTTDMYSKPWACYREAMMDENGQLLTFQDGEDLITGCEYWEGCTK